MVLRVGTSDYPLHPAIPLIWNTIRRDLCEPVEFVPPDIWFGNSSSYAEALAEKDVVDVLDDLWVMNTEFRNVSFTSTAYYARPVLLLNDSNGLYSETVEWFSADLFLGVFGPYMWLTIFMAFALLMTFNWLLSRFDRSHGHLGLSGWKWFEHFCLHSSLSTGNLPLSRLSKQVIILTGAFSIHSLALYQGSLLTNLIRAKPVHFADVHTWDDVLRLVKSGRIVTDLLHPDGRFAQFLYEQNGWPEFRQALVRNPPFYSLLMTPEEKAANDRNLASTERSRLSMTSSVAVVARLYHDRGCQAQFATTPMAMDMAFMISRRLNGTRLECLNRAIRVNGEHILAEIEAFESSIVDRYHDCRMRNFRLFAAWPGDPITLKRLSILLLVWLGGMALAVACFAVELIRRPVRESLAFLAIDWR